MNISKTRKYLSIEHFGNRDIKFQVNLNMTKVTLDVSKSKTPLTYSLNKYRKFIYDQGYLGSCTANAFCAAYRIMNTIQKKNSTFQPSRLFFYYQERVIEGNVNIDAGANVIDGEEYVKTNGICSETSWPYITSKFNIKPPQTCYIEASKYKISKYSIINNDSNLITNIKKAIFNKQPVLIGIAVYSSFETYTVSITGLVPIPDTLTEQLLGGHEMCLIGYDEAKQLFTVMNSWGSNWGDSGLCYIPYNYLSNPSLGLDFTVIYL